MSTVVLYIHMHQTELLHFPLQKQFDKFDPNNHDYLPSVHHDQNYGKDVVNLAGGIQHVIVTL